MVKPLQARGRLPTEGLPPRRLGDGREQDCAKGEQRSLALQVDCLGACVSSRANGCREGLQIGARVGDAEEDRAAAEKEEEWVESSKSASLALACRLYPRAANPNTPSRKSLGTRNKAREIQAKALYWRKTHGERERQHQLT